MKVILLLAQDRSGRSRSKADSHRAFARLPRRERAVIELVYRTELSLLVIGGYLDVPLATVKRWTRAALAHLAEHLEHEPQR